MKPSEEIGWQLENVTISVFGVDKKEIVKILAELFCNSKQHCIIGKIGQLYVKNTITLILVV